MAEYRFLWDDRPDMNIVHIALHGMTPYLWEAVFSRQFRSCPDRDDPSVMIGEGRVQQKLYRIVYEIHESIIIPITIIPITGFPISRKGIQ